jgi:hypothetical protein
MAVDPIVGPLLTLVGVVAASYLTYRVSSRKLQTDQGQQLMDQHQEDIRELRADRAADRARILAQDRVIRTQADYIGELRRHIANAEAPPPPPYPPGLIT